MGKVVKKDFNKSPILRVGGTIRRIHNYYNYILEMMIERPDDFSRMERIMSKHHYLSTSLF